jgi:hypothetical protein
LICNSDTPSELIAPIQNKSIGRLRLPERPNCILAVQAGVRYLLCPKLLEAFESKGVTIERLSSF